MNLDFSFLPSNAALREYLPGIVPSSPTTDSSHSEQPFLSYYDFLPNKTVSMKTFSRNEFWILTMKAIALIRRVVSTSLSESTPLKGLRMIHYVSGNIVEDLAIRCACVFLGTVPVTINWQADIEVQIDYKITSTSSVIIFVDSKTPNVEQLQQKYPDKRVVNVNEIHATEPISSVDLLSYLRHACTTSSTSSSGCDSGIPLMDDIRCIIFTSGTTGHPKGVELSYANYHTNRCTFESFLDLEDSTVTFVPIVVNPMHHTNSTSITDWALRRPGSQLHLLERYSTQYWSIVSSVVMQCSLQDVADMTENEDVTVKTGNVARRVVCPLVSRHIDFLESLADTPHGLGMSPKILRECLSQTVLLLGSAPVGPTTTKRLMKYANRLPTVRFGSTETTLQISGIPLSLSVESTMAAFQAGWEHQYQGQPCQGFYIGREHQGLTEVTIVRSINREDKEKFLQPCVDGEPGYIITRGGHVMKSYVNQPDLTVAAVTTETLDGKGRGGWYIKLGDMGFVLGPDRDLYWQSRDSQMLIRGGANYAFEQVNAELTTFLATQYPVLATEQGTPSFAVAVCGLRVLSEHEDECCVMIELLNEDVRNSGVAEEIMRTFLSSAKTAVSKGAKPDRVAIGTIPMVLSKGIVNVPELVKYWKETVTAAAAKVVGGGHDSNGGNGIGNDSSSNKRPKISNS